MKTHAQPAAAQDNADVGAGSEHPGVDEHELRRAIARDELLMLFQPKIRAHSLEIGAVEALVRWNHPRHGILKPVTFIGLAEESGLIDDLTTEVMHKTLAQWTEWRALGIELRTAINISARSLTNLELPDQFTDIAATHAVPTHMIVLEITESWPNHDVVAAQDILTRLRIKGFDLAIDDFGTGYSSMRQLKEIPYSELKVDQSFIREASFDDEARTIVELSIDLGHKLGLHVVAEGVETQDAWDLVSELGCDEGQGYFIARPMRGEQLPAWVQHWNRSLGQE